MKKWKFILAVGVLLVLVLIYVIKEYNRSNANTENLKASIDIDADLLVKRFEMDDLRANNEFNGKVIYVSGQVAKIEKSDETVRVMLGDGKSMNGVICEFQKEEIKKINELKLSQQVKIKGVCTGMLLDVILVRCVLD